MSADVSEDGVLGFVRCALDYAEVLFLGLSLGELGNERLVGWVVFGADDAARSIFIESVDDAWSLDSADAGELSLAVVEEGVDEGARAVSGSGVDDEPGGFVDDDDVFVFMEDIEWDIFWLGVVWLGLWDFNGDDVALIDGGFGFGDLAVDEDVTRFEQGLDAGAGELWDLGAEENVEAFFFSFVDGDLHGVGGEFGGLTGAGEKKNQLICFFQCAFS